MTDALPLADAARLVGSVSDNLATNVLLEHVGLSAVQSCARGYAPRGSTLLDVVRDERQERHAVTLSTGCASDWASVFQNLYLGEVHTAAVGRMVLDWLASGSDLSMVAVAFGLDPLSHGCGPDLGFSLWNKTGTDLGVRADIGVISRGTDYWVYSVICNWDPRDEDRRHLVLDAMRGIGVAIRAELT
jgi:beta-lactamase class A